MTKTYADICLERANKATNGRWHEVDGERILVDLRDLPEGSDGLLADIFDPAMKTGGSQAQTGQTVANAKFFEHSKQDVEELAKRLNKACDILRLLSSKDHDIQRWVEELEAPLEDK